MKTNKAFSLVEIMVALALLGMMALGITRMMDNIHTGLKSQKDVEMRTELFQVLNRIKSSVDCNKTMVSAPSLPTSGSSPIALYRRGTSTLGAIVNDEGSNFGRFSVIANLLPRPPGTFSIGIQIQAAAFKTPPSSPRDHLSDPDSAFAKKKIGTGLWDWATVGTMIRSEFPEMGTLCSDWVADAPAPSPDPNPAPAPAPAPGSPPTPTPTPTATPTPAPTAAFVYPNFSCPSGKFIKKFENGVPVCGTPPTGGGGGGGSVSVSVSPKWNLDRDCAPTAPNCSLCQNLITAGTCPANPGGLNCSSPGGKCVTPGGCRRYVCN